MEDRTVSLGSGGLVERHKDGSFHIYQIMAQEVAQVTR